MSGTKTYNRLMAGNRLYQRRKQLGWSRAYVSGKIGKVEKYYSDIERGICGMSIETLLALSKLYALSLDYIIYGSEENSKGGMPDKGMAVLNILKELKPEEYECCLDMMLVFANRFGRGGVNRMSENARYYHYTYIRRDSRCFVPSMVMKDIQIVC